MLGLVCAQRRNFRDAERFFGEALKLNPDNSDAQFNYGNVLLGLQKFDDAFSAFGKALALNPALAEAHLNRGNIFMFRKRFEEALACFDAAIRVDPNSAEVHCNRGHALDQMERLDAALASYDAALKLNPQNAEFHAGRANVLNHMGRNEEALADHLTALSLRPDDAGFHANHGNILYGLNRYDEAFSAFEKAVSLQPNFAYAHYNEGFCRLLLGDTERGWKKYEYRWEGAENSRPRRNFSQPNWLGNSSIAGKTILIHAEQGYGDTLMVCRYVPRVAALGARVILEVPSALLRLMEGLEGVSMIVPRGADIPAFDIHCPIMSLPLAFKTRLDTIPDTIPYLQVPKEDIGHWHAKLGNGGFKVGIAWAGSTAFKQDRDRSITLKNILPVCSVQGPKYFSIQKLLRDGDVAILHANPQILQLGEDLADFQETAAAMMSLDLIISSDTSIVHLAGALGKPVWVLLPFKPDWRWLLDRSDSPWYPTARLFRQRQRGDWVSVTNEVRSELEKLVRERQKQPA